MKMIVTLALLGLSSGCVYEENLGNTPAQQEPPPQEANVFGEPRWTIALGDVGIDRAMAIAIDPNGDVVAAGHFETVGFITKRAAVDGSEEWTVLLDGYHCEVNDIAIDSDGNVIVTGVFAGLIDFGGESLDAEAGVSEDMFVAKYDTAGDLLWVTGLGAESIANGLAVSIGPEGIIYAIGWFGGLVDFGSGPLQNTGDSYHDAYLVAYDPTGKLEWGRAIQGNGNQVLYGVAATAEGPVITGAIHGATTFGGDVLAPNGYEAGVLARFTATGEHVWSRVVELDGASRMLALDVEVTASDEIVFTTDETRDNRNNGGIRIWDLDGEELTAVLPVTGGTTTHALALATDGTVLTGGFVGSLQADFGTGAVDQGMYLVAHDTIGDALDARSYADPSPATDIVWGIDTTAEGGIALSGHFDGTIDLGLGVVTGSGDSDALIAFFDPPAE